jgi:hypothetical protein
LWLRTDGATLWFNSGDGVYGSRRSPGRHG